MFTFAGLPPPSIDIIEILKNPVLYPTPLWIDPKDLRKETKPSGLENFCKAMGWTWKEGELPTKILKSRSKKQVIDNEPIHAGHGKTDIAKEMKSCVLKGIEKKESVEKLTDKKAAKLRKVTIGIFLELLHSDNVLILLPEKKYHLFSK